MDWNITPLAKKSYLSDVSFEKGDRIASILTRIDPETVERIDVLVSEETQVELPGVSVCRWTHVYKPKQVTDGREEAEAMKLTADNLFISLFEGEEDPSPENGKLKQFLALMLERRRVLRVKEKGVGSVLYVHRPSKNEYSVRNVELDPDFFLNNKEKLDFLVQVPTESETKKSEGNSSE